MALLSGIACWFWALPQLATGSRPSLAPGVSELAEVAPGDIPGALATMDGANSLLAQWRQQDRSCSSKLAWVTIAGAPGEPPGTVRLRSGGYFSPVFTLSSTPMRVAIPYPAPYEAGRGTLSVLDAGADATVALNPAWHVSARSGGMTRVVTWRPAERCTR